jgi:type I restriction enzyme R subunit
VAGDDNTASAAKDALDALILFKNDMGAYVRLYAFLSQIFDYGNTGIEKRFIFFKRLLPLLDFGRERDTVDLSKVVLTHHSLKNQGQRPMSLRQGAENKLAPMNDVGSGGVQDKEQAFITEIIQKMNGLFEGELTDNDKLVYVNGVIKGKILENYTLIQQAASNSKAQLSNSPDLKEALLNALIETHEAHQLMSTQALNSVRLREDILDILMGPGQLLSMNSRSKRSTGPSPVHFANGRGTPTGKVQGEAQLRRHARAGRGRRVRGRRPAVRGPKALGHRAALTSPA